MAYKTDSQLIQQAIIIREETRRNANTAQRIGELFIDMIDSKLNDADLPSPMVRTVSGPTVDNTDEENPIINLPTLSQLEDDATHRLVTDVEKATWNALIGGAVFQTVWNATTNSPALASGTGTKGHYYITNVAGSTNLDGIVDWKIGDWAIFDGTVYRKVDNTDAVSSVNGLTGAVSLDTSVIASTLDKRYVTDAELIILSNTSGVNTGDDAVNTTANSYADSLAANYDVAGSAAQALTDANSYTDSLAANYDVAGSAAQALTDANLYTDSGLSLKQDVITGSDGYVYISGGVVTYDTNIYLTTSDASSTYLTQTAASATYLTQTAASATYLTQNETVTLSGEATGSGRTSISVTVGNSAVINKVLTGLNLGSGGTISSTDTILQAFGKVQNQLSAMLGGVIYKGVWNATTNSPSLTSSTGTQGNYYIVSVAGSTNLDGIIDWKLGDWAIFDGTVWDKVDNTDAVSSVNGFTGAVSLSTSNILEGSNLYYTSARVNTQVATYTGDVTLSSTTFSIGSGKVTNTMLAGSIADSKLASSYVYSDGSRALTSNWNVGAYILTAQSYSVSGTSGLGFTEYISQGSNTATPSSSGMRVFATSNGANAWVRKNGSDTYVRILDGTITADRTYTLQDSSDTFVMRATTDTLTNKTISASSNTLGSVTMTLGSDADGDLYYRSSNVLTRLAKGTALQTLRMNAGATAPEWATASTTMSLDSVTAAAANSDINNAGYQTIWRYNSYGGNIYGFAVFSATGTGLSASNGSLFAVSLAGTAQTTTFNTSYAAVFSNTSSGSGNFTNYCIQVNASGGSTNNIAIEVLAGHFKFDTSTGTKFGTATSQKIAFYNSTPIVQPGAATDLGTVLSNLGLRASGTAYPITTSGAVSFSGTFGSSGVSSFTNSTDSTTSITGAVKLTGGMGIAKALYVGTNVGLQHLIGTSSAPTIAAGAGAGTSPTVSISGTDISGVVSVTSGTTPTGSAVVVTITFNVAYGAAPKAINLTPANANAAGLGTTSMVFIDSAGITTTTFAITSGTIGLVAATSYKWYYQAIQ
jgi:hypothetical protein